MTTPVHLSAVKILRIGLDRDHLYIKGRGEVPGQGECDIYAHFISKEKGCEFERQFTGESVVIEAQSLEFTQGIGGSVREIASWRIQ